MNFPKNLKRYRSDRKITQHEIAKFLEISERAYRNYELGKNEPSLSDLVKISRLLRVSLDDLIIGDDSEDPLMDPEHVF